MASSAGPSEIVEVRDEVDLLQKFNRANLLQVKVRAKEVKSHGYPVVDDPDLLIDASKKPAKAGTSRALGSGTSESPSLKQALRRSCISQASEMAAIKRSSKLIGSSSVSDTETIERLYMSVVVESSKPSLSLDKEARNSREGASKAGASHNVKSSWNSSVSSPGTAVAALRNAKMRRTQDLISAEQVKGTGNLKAGKPMPQNDAGTRNKGKQESAPAFGNSSRLNKFREVGALHCKTKSTSSKAISPTSGQKNPDGTVGNKNNSNGSEYHTLKVIEGLVSREKGECSQSSQSSLGDCSSSTTISEESSYCASSSNCNRPHMSKDVKWAAIQHVVNEQGSLGLKNFKLLRRLGCGDIGTVYLAELLGSGYLFALKVMDVEFLVRRKKMLRAQTERDILQMLDHPFLPTLYTHFTTDNLSFLVMEYCPRGDLHVLRQMQPGRSFREPAARHVASSETILAHSSFYLSNYLKWLLKFSAHLFEYANNSSFASFGNYS